MNDYNIIYMYKRKEKKREEKKRSSVRILIKKYCNKTKIFCSKKKNLNI